MDEQELPIVCPNTACRTVLSKPLSWFKSNMSFTCHKCGVTYGIDFEGLRLIRAIIDKVATV